MNLTIRRFLYIFFILLFFCLAPLLIFYAKGYRYDFKNSQVVKNGLLVLETKPATVKVFLNNQPTTLKPPLKGVNFKTGFYDLKIKKPGYYPWGKNIEIKSGLTTFFQDVILFKNTPPIKIIDGDFTDFTLSPDESKIITLWQNNNSAEIWNYDLTNNNNFLVNRLSLLDSKLKIKNWSPNNKNLLFENSSLIDNKKTFFVIYALKNLSNNNQVNIINLENIFNQPITNIKWDNHNDDLLYLTTTSGLYQVNLKDKTNTLIDEVVASDFIVYDKILLFDQTKSCLTETEKIARQLTPENKCLYPLENKNYQIFSGPMGITTVLSPESNELLVIDLNNKTKIFQSQANNIEWNYSGEKMLYYDNIEVGTFSPGHEKPYQQEVIGRYSEDVIKAIWYTENHHLIILLKDNIKIIELDARDQRNTVEINNFSDLKNIQIDKKGENIYVAGKRDGKEGIFQINIF